MRERTLLLGLGNTLLQDDGAGIHVVREFRKRYGCPAGLDIRESQLAGLNLLELLTGYDRVIIVDAIETGRMKPGSVYRFTIEDVQDAVRGCSPHLIGLPSIIQIGRRCGYSMPSLIEVFAIEAHRLYAFGEGLSDELKAALPKIVRLLRKEIHRSARRVHGAGHE